MWRTCCKGRTRDGLRENGMKQGGFYWGEGRRGRLILSGLAGRSGLVVLMRPAREDVERSSKLYADINARRIKNPLKESALAGAAKVSMRTRLLAGMAAAIGSVVLLALFAGRRSSASARARPRLRPRERRSQQTCTPVQVGVELSSATAAGRCSGVGVRSHAPMWRRSSPRVARPSRVRTRRTARSPR